MTALPLLLPPSRAVGKSQLGPSPPSLPLFAGQPLPQGGNQVVVCQLVILVPGADLWVRQIRSDAFRVGRRDQPDFVVQDSNQILEVLRAICISRGVQELLAGLHLPLDVRSLFREQRFEDRTGRFLVEAMAGRSEE